MAQHTDIALTAKTYTRQDFTALRAHILKIPLERIRALYYDDDSPQVNGPGGLERFLLDMRDDLITRTLSRHPHAAQYLQKARLGGPLTDKALQVIFEAAQVQTTAPQSNHPLSMWFRPRVVTALKTTGSKTVAELAQYINLRGSGWWRSVPRIGRLRARAVETWYRQHTPTLDLSLQLTAMPLGELVPLRQENEFILPGTTRNAGAGFCLISAQNDIEAAQAFLLRYRGESRHTQDSYRKEVTRLLFFCAKLAKKSLQKLTVEDLEFFKDFLANPPTHLIGRKARRGTPQWRPFAGPLAISSQRAALRTVQVFLNWLTQVRYLASNPLATIKMPRDTQPKQQFIAKALDPDTWDKLCVALDNACQQPQDMQTRMARAVTLICGDSGLRREEVANIERDWLTEIEPDIWLLKVLGKGNKWREVTLSPRAIQAIIAHWKDRDLDFYAPLADSPIIAPVITKNTQRDPRRGYNPNSLARAVVNRLRYIAHQANLDWVALDKIEQATVHHLRHTFGAEIVKVAPIQIAQQLLGHANIQTTTIYTRTDNAGLINAMKMLHQKAKQH